MRSACSTSQAWTPRGCWRRASLTDTYLLALAVHHGGTLVSFDRRLGCGAVAGGRAALCLIDG
jgi:hypothetical protein